MASRISAMWGDKRVEWQLNEDEFGFEIFDRVLGDNDSAYGDNDYVEANIIPLFYRVLKYGICK